MLCLFAFSFRCVANSGGAHLVTMAYGGSCDVLVVADLGFPSVQLCKKKLVMCAGWNDIRTSRECVWCCRPSVRDKSELGGYESRVWQGMEVWTNELIIGTTQGVLKVPSICKKQSLSIDGNWISLKR